MDYNVGYSASCDYDKGKDHYNSKMYSCTDCGQGLYDHETWYGNGGIYCGTCYQSR